MVRRGGANPDHPDPNHPHPNPNLLATLTLPLPPPPGDRGRAADHHPNPDLNHPTHYQVTEDELQTITQFDFPTREEVMAGK